MLRMSSLPQGCANSTAPLSVLEDVTEVSDLVPSNVNKASGGTEPNEVLLV